MAKLTYKQKKRLPKSAFALPTGRYDGSYPIHDIAHARCALARVSAHGTPAEKAAVRRAVYARYPELKARAQARARKK
jgi:hypothetical protein